MSEFSTEAKEFESSEHWLGVLPATDTRASGPQQYVIAPYRVGGFRTKGQAIAELNRVLAILHAKRTVRVDRLTIYFGSHQSGIYIIAGTEPSGDHPPTFAVMVPNT